MLCISVISAHTLRCVTSINVTLTQLLIRQVINVNVTEVSEVIISVMVGQSQRFREILFRKYFVSKLTCLKTMSVWECKVEFYYCHRDNWKIWVLSWIVWNILLFISVLLVKLNTSTAHTGSFLQVQRVRKLHSLNKISNSYQVVLLFFFTSMLPESPPDSSSEACSPPQIPGSTETQPPASHVQAVTSPFDSYLILCPKAHTQKHSLSL